MTTTTYLIIAAAVLVFIVIFQIAKASEYVSVLKGEETSRKQNNRINGFMLLGFMIVGLLVCTTVTNCCTNQHSSRRVLLLWKVKKSMKCL